MESISLCEDEALNHFIILDYYGAKLISIPFIFLFTRYSPQQQQHLLDEGNEEDADRCNINNDINHASVNSTDNTNINKYSNRITANNSLPSSPEYNFSLHMESCTAGIITRSALNRFPAPTADAADVVDIRDSIGSSQTMSFQSRQQREYKMEDFPVFPSHHTNSTYQHQQQGWPVRYQSSNMPTSGFFHVTPPPPHVAFDEAALELDARHHLNIDSDLAVTGTTADTIDSFHSSNSNSINSPNSTDSRGVSSMNTTLPSESASSSAFPTPMKTPENKEQSLSSKKISKRSNGRPISCHPSHLSAHFHLNFRIVKALMLSTSPYSRRSL